MHRPLPCPWLLPAALIGLFRLAPCFGAPEPERAPDAPTQVAQEVFQGPEFWWKRTERVEYAPSGLVGFLRTVAERLWDILGKFLEWLLRFLQSMAMFATGDWSGGTPVVWVAAASVLAWAAWKLARWLLRRERTGSGAVDGIAAADCRKLPEADALFQQAAEAAHAGRYADTVRLALLALIAHLQQRGLLRYDPTRTNREYRSELRGEPALARMFGQVARPYERVWYGRLPATPADAEQVMDLCRTVLAGKGCPE